ncbi:MAG: hypothetical protein CM15mP127_01640 [Gammaproteobacteria bacterium]|nr:MAG: hypothetical protein CM15mP127_01640 [Gammaproteobacteria bacterium]
MLTFGIPEFKLEKSIVKKRRRIFESMGINFKLNCEIGVDISFDVIMNDYDAIFLGTGTFTSLQEDLRVKIY